MRSDSVKEKERLEAKAHWIQRMESRMMQGYVFLFQEL